MYEYLVLALMLMALCDTNNSAPSSECETDFTDWFQCWESDVGEGTCVGEPNSAWILSSDVCNGQADCPNGEDESIVICKREPSRLHSAYFYCANGAVIELSKKCNRKVDCSDGSDEMPAMCRPKKKINRRGKCKRYGSFECSPGRCIYNSQQCNGIHDCANGFDESLEVCYQPWHNDTQFQCGNGRLIPVRLICNGNYDCIDGSDELPIMCEQDTTGSTNQCEEPPAPLSFTLNTKYHRGINGIKYVLPNEAVRVQCIPSKKLVGNEWNVCKANGDWAFNWPRCTHTKH